MHVKGIKSSNFVISPPWKIEVKLKPGAKRTFNNHGPYTLNFVMQAWI
jgi:hypothetical protein